MQLIYQHNRRIFSQPQQQQVEMDPPIPPPAGADPVLAAQMRIMQQMADTETLKSGKELILNVDKEKIAIRLDLNNPRGIKFLDFEQKQKIAYVPMAIF